MPDIFLYQGQANPNDVRLTNPSAPPITGTAADLTQTAATIAATGAEIFTGTLDRSQTAATIAATGLLEFLGTSSLTQTAATIAAAGSEVFTGTLARSQASATIAATGLEQFLGTSSLTQSAHTSATDATEVFTGTAALDQSTHTITAEGLITGASASPVIAGGGIRRLGKQPYRWGVLIPDPVSGQAQLEQSAHRMQAGGIVSHRRGELREHLTQSEMGLAELAPPIITTRRLPVSPSPRLSVTLYAVQSRHTMRARGTLSTEQLELEEALACLLLLTAANSQK